LLSRVVDSANRETSFEYSTYNLNQSLICNALFVNGAPWPGITNYGAYLTKITFPTGLVTCYGYGKYRKYLGLDGEMDFFKITERFDIKKDGNILNYKKFNYKINGTNEYDGYPSYRPGSGYFVSTQILDNTNNSTIYNFYDFARDTGTYQINKLLCYNQVSEGTDYKESISFYYEPTNWILCTFQMVQKLSKIYNSSKSNYTLKIEDFKYNRYGDLINYWGPKSNRNYDGSYSDLKKSNYVLSNINSDEYLVTYSYTEPDWMAEFSVLLLNKTYKKDQNTAIKEDYTLDSTKSITQPHGQIASIKDVRWKKVYENNVLKSQTWYDYDTYGNVKEKRDYLDDWTNYITTKYVYDDNDTARNGKFNGCYITKSSTEGVKDADNNSIGTVSENYKYNWFGELIEKDDAKGNPTIYQYDGIGRKTKETNPDSTCKQWIYNDSENTLTTIDEKNNSFKYGYDESGNPIFEQNMTNGEFLKYDEYDSRGALSGEYDSIKSSTQYYYNNETTKKQKNNSHGLPIAFLLGLHYRIQMMLGLGVTIYQEYKAIIFLIMLSDYTSIHLKML
jgi:YD repeat-containing protein